MVFADFVNNSDASQNDTGWTLGTRVGQAKDRGQWQFPPPPPAPQPHPMLGLLTDSDFAGGGTDNNGHFFKIDYGVSKNWSIGAQYFINETGVSSGDKRDYKVNFDKINSQLPGFSCDWTVAKGAQQLLNLFRYIHLDTELFQSAPHTRLKQINHLVATDQLDADFFWKKLDV